MSNIKPVVDNLRLGLQFELELLDVCSFDTHDFLIDIINLPGVQLIFPKDWGNAVLSTQKLYLSFRMGTVRCNADTDITFIHFCAKTGPNGAEFWSLTVIKVFFLLKVCLRLFTNLKIHESYDSTISGYFFFRVTWK